MSKDKLILKNKTEIELEAGASLGALQVASADRATMLATWELMTPDNLSEVQIKNGSGLTVGIYTGLVLASETSIERSDGSILTTYRLREKTAEEQLTERVKALEETTDILTIDALSGGETA